MIRPASSITLPNIICIINYDETVSGLMHYINCEKDKSTSTTDRSAGFTSGPWGPVTAEQKSRSGVGSLSQARLKRYPRAAGHDLTVLFSRKRWPAVAHATWAGRELQDSAASSNI